MTVDQPQARAALGLLAALILAAAVLWWGFRDDGRPRGYKGRHRAPEPTPAPDTEGSEEVEHEGATEAYAAKLAEVRAEAEAEAAAEPEHMSLEAVLKEVTDEHEIQEAHAELETGHISAETRAEFDAVWGAVEDAVIVDRMRTAAALARWERAPRPTYDRSAAREQTWTDPFEEVTELIDVRGLRELVGAR